MSVGERIKKRRKELGMNAETLAAKVGVSAATIYRYENGDIEKVGSEKLKPIADALRTTPADLMGWEDNSTPVISDERKQKIAVANDMMSQLTPENLDIATALLKAMIDKQ